MFERREFREQAREKIAQRMADHIAGHHHGEHPRFKLMVAIVDREKTDKVIKLMKKNIRRRRGPKLLYIVTGIGTAASDFLDILGIGTDEREILFYISAEQETAALTEALEEGLNMKKPGKGIIFSLPINHFYSLFTHHRRDDMMENNIPKNENTSENCLIAVIVNEGCSEKVMEAARAAGTRGGTVIKARRVDMDEHGKLFDIPVSLEKEVLLILAKTEHGREIAQSIKCFCGMQAEEKGIMFSLPADDIAGISL